MRRFGVLLFALTAVRAAAQPLKLPADFAERSQQYMKARASVTGFSGAVLVARDGRPVFRQAYGMANQELEIANTPRTKFRLGSVTKQFTAAAILLLEQQGRLSVSDPVSKYLPDWPQTWKDVTLHHLLSHISGLPRLTTQAMLDVSALSRATPTPYRGVKDLMTSGEESQPLDSRPGEKFAYSNVGYIVLGMVIEKVSEKNYCSFLSDEVFRPLAMADTRCDDPAVILKQRASGYTRVDGALTNAGYVDVRFVTGAGALVSTLDDLLLWDRALTSNLLLNAAEREKLFIPALADYAYGWWIQTQLGHTFQWHGGNVSGFVSEIARYPDDHLFVVVLSNVWSSADRSQVRTMVYELAAMAFGQPYKLPRGRKQIKLDAAVLDSYTGDYVGKDTFAIAREGDRLMVQFPPGQSVLEILPESPTEFFAKGREHFFTFTKDAQGRVIDVVVRNEGQLGRWKKSR